METDVKQLQQRVVELEAQVEDLQRQLRGLQSFSDELVRAVNQCTCD